MQLRGYICLGLAYSEVNQSTPQISFLDPLCDGLIVAVRNQQGKCKIVQHAFGSTFPGCLLFPDTDQFTGEGQFIGIEFEGFTKFIPDADLMRMDIRAALTQRVQFFVYFVVLLLVFSERHRQFGILVT